LGPNKQASGIDVKLISGQFYITVIGGDRAVWYRTFSAGWASLSGYSTSSPTVNADLSFEVVGGDNQLYRRTLSTGWAVVSSAPSGPFNISYGGRLTTRSGAPWTGVAVWFSGTYGTPRGCIEPVNSNGQWSGSGTLYNPLQGNFTFHVMTSGCVQVIPTDPPSITVDFTSANNVDDNINFRQL
jgi:hypothetical protein